MTTTKENFKVVTIGGATMDISFKTEEGVLINNKQDVTRQKLVGFEYGAKLYIEDADFSFGGGAANSAVCFSRLEAAANSMLVVGDDKIGQAILDNLKTEKVNVVEPQLSAKSSGLSMILVYGQETRDHVLFAFRGANEDLKIDGAVLENLRADWIYLSSLSGKSSAGVLNKVFGTAKKQQIKVAWNPGSQQIKLGLEELSPFLKNTQVLILNKDEAIELVMREKGEGVVNSKNLILELSKYCPGIILVTEGENGAHAFYVKRFYFEEVKSVKKMDTTGVGDAFGSTFVWAYEFFKGDIQAALEVASINAAAVITKQGAQKGLLNKKELLKKL